VCGGVYDREGITGEIGLRGGCPTRYGVSERGSHAVGDWKTAGGKGDKRAIGELERGDTGARSRWV